MAREVLAPETAWWEQACLRLKISGGCEDSSPPQPYVIISPQGSSQSHPGEIQRETLSKTVRGSDRSWPALTERD